MDKIAIIEQAVCKSFDVDSVVFLSKSKAQVEVLPRFALWWILVEELGMSYEEIAIEYNKRNALTVRNGVAKIEEQWKKHRPDEYKRCMDAFYTARTLLAVSE